MKTARLEACMLFLQATWLHCKCFAVLRRHQAAGPRLLQTTLWFQTDLADIDLVDIDPELESEQN
jgi:hypothetical protein